MYYYILITTKYYKLNTTIKYTKVNNNDDIKQFWKGSLMMVLNRFLNGDAKKVPQWWYKNGYKIYALHLSSFKVSKKVKNTLD